MYSPDLAGRSTLATGQIGYRNGQGTRNARGVDLRKRWHGFCFCVGMTSTSAFSSESVAGHERTRVAQHIARAEHAARARPPRALGSLQRLVRALLLEELASYRRRARFPRNDVCRQRTPLFVDRHGTRCAMAHLLELGGERALVEKIRTTRNGARIAELADEPRLLAWLAAAGLTVSEAAAIQPAYCFQGPPTCVCSAGYTGYADKPPAVLTVIEGTLERESSDSSTVFVKISKVHGAPSDFAVGDTVSAHSPDIPPEDELLTMLIPLRTEGARDAASDELEAIPLYDDVHECRRASGRPLSLDKDRFIAALLSADCPRTLASYGPEWKRPRCRDGCSTQPGTNGDLLGSAMILLSLLATMSLRRLRSRRA